MRRSRRRVPARGAPRAFGFTQGDEVQGLLAPGADPFRAVLRAALQPDARTLRWASSPATSSPAPGPPPSAPVAFLAAREAIARARAQRDGLVAITGDPEADALLADLGPLLPALLADLTPRQREVARLILLDELRRSEAAEHLHVSRATVSVIADRARVRHLQGLARALAAIFAEGAAAEVAGATATAPRRDGRRRRRERGVTDTVLVLTWLVFAHLVADFVLQNDWIAMNKATGGREGWRALGVHGLHVGLCLVPAVLAFGLPGPRLPRRRRRDPHDRRPLEGPGHPARRGRGAGAGARADRAHRPGAASGLGAAWTPWPGILFLADQALHLTFAIVGWLVILAGAALLPEFVDFVNRVLGAGTGPPSTR